MEEATVEVPRLIHEATEPGSYCALVPMLKTTKLFYVEAIFGNLFAKVLFSRYDVPEFLEVVTAWARLAIPTMETRPRPGNCVCSKDLSC